MERNVSSQYLTLFAFDYSTGAPKTGDQANLTPYVSVDDGAVTVLTNAGATQLDATNAPGMYKWLLTSGETNGTKLIFTCKSSTANVSIVPQVIYTTPPNFSLMKLDTSLALGYATVYAENHAGEHLLTNTYYDSYTRLTSGTVAAGAAGTVTLAAGASSVDDFYKGRAISIISGTGVGQTRVCTAYNGTTKVATISPNWATNPAAAATYYIGLLDASSVPQTGDCFARLTGTGAVTFASLDVSGATTLTGAVTASNASNDIRVDARKLGGTTQTGRDVGLSVLISSGTGTGQIALTSGKVSPADNSISSATFASGAITASAIAADAIGASELASDAVSEIVAAVWRNTTAADFTQAGSIGLSVMNGVALGTGLTVAAVGAGGITASSIATGAIDADSLAADAGTEIAAAVQTSIDTNGVQVADGSISSAAFTVAALTGVETGILEQIVQLWRRFFKKSTLTATQLKTYADDGTTVVTTQTVSDDATTQTQGAAS